MTYALEVSAFRSAFPAFDNPETYSDETLAGYWETSTFFISTDDYGYLSGAARGRALNLMTAHLAALADMINAGETPALESAATVDKVSVTLTPPPVKSHFLWWLSLTGYGQQLAALLSVKAVGGFFVSAFRNPRGFN